MLVLLQMRRGRLLRQASTTVCGKGHRGQTVHCRYGWYCTVNFYVLMDMREGPSEGLHVEFGMTCSKGRVSNWDAATKESVESSTKCLQYLYTTLVKQALPSCACHHSSCCMQSPLPSHMSKSPSSSYNSQSHQSQAKCHRAPHFHVYAECEAARSAAPIPDPSFDSTMLTFCAASFPSRLLSVSTRVPLY